MEKYSQLSSVPAPFLGCADAPVVLLNLNPGGEKLPPGWQEDEIARARPTRMGHDDDRLDGTSSPFDHKDVLQWPPQVDAHPPV
jgi:hypothetical protein